jgi:hypothetical protein
MQDTFTLWGTNLNSKSISFPFKDNMPLPVDITGNTKAQLQSELLLAD